MRDLKGIIRFISGVLAFCCMSFFINAATNHPQRIISLGPSITEQLYLLEAQDKLIGCTIYCRRPQEAKTKEKVGTVVEVNLEKIVSLKPDLVIATPLTNPKAIEKLRNLGIKVLVFSSPKNFIELCKQFLELGKLVDKEKAAEDLIRQAENKVAAIKRNVENLPKPKVFIQVGAKPLVTVTKDSFVNDFIEFAGGMNIASNAKIGLYSREEVLMKNPDVIIIVTMGIAGEKEQEIWKKYSALEAVKNNRIYIIDSDKVCSPTPISFVQTLEELVDILQ